MTKHLIDIDGELFDDARRVLDAGTVEDTVRRALQSAVQLDRRRRHVLRLQDLPDLADDEVMSSAWR